MRSRAVLDLRTCSIDDLLATTGKQLDTSLDPGSVRFGGEDGATCGARTSRDTWVRLQHRQPGDDIAPAWTAEESAAAITGVRKPAWHQAATWHDPGLGVEWRADELDLVHAPVLGGLTAPPTTPLSDSWWSDLRRDLAKLATQPTDRITLDQAELTQDITREFGDDIDTTVEEWSTAHGDLCWANITTAGDLVDWEYWGRAPRGLDASTLWGMALPDPQLAEQVQQTFSGDLTSRTGRLVQLMWCATALRATASRADLALYRDPVSTAAYRLRRELTEERENRVWTDDPGNGVWKLREEDDE